MSLHKSLKAIYVIDLLLLLVTVLTMVPLMQIDGKYLDLHIVLVLIKMTALIIALLILRQVIYYQRMK